MRKLDVAILLILSALGAYYWRSNRPGLAPQPTLTPNLTRSGRWEVLSGPMSVAGLTMGSSEAAILKSLGQPAERRQENSETSQWFYRSDGAELGLTLLEGRLVAAVAVGRWGLSFEDKPVAGFMATQAQLRGWLGEPSRTEPTGAYGEGAWIYTRRPGELTFHFQQGRVAQFLVTGEVKPRKV